MIGSRPPARLPFSRDLDGISSLFPLLVRWDHVPRSSSVLLSFQALSGLSTAHDPKFTVERSFVGIDFVSDVINSYLRLNFYLAFQLVLV